MWEGGYYNLVDTEIIENCKTWSSLLHLFSIKNKRTQTDAAKLCSEVPILLVLGAVTLLREGRVINKLLKSLASTLTTRLLLQKALSLIGVPKSKI